MSKGQLESLFKNRLVVDWSDHFTFVCIKHVHSCLECRSAVSELTKSKSDGEVTQVIEKFEIIEDLLSEWLDRRS